MSIKYPSPNYYAQNIIRAYAMTSEKQRLNGKVWYAQARELAREMSRISAAQDQWPRLNTLGCAAIISALSPRQKWADNERNALRLMIDFYGRVPVSEKAYYAGTMHANKRRAIAVLETGDHTPITRGKGEKTRNFAWGIATGGRFSSLVEGGFVTIDVHSRRIAEGQYWHTPPQATGILYRVMQRAYVVAANALGISPIALQAGTWELLAA